MYKCCTHLSCIQFHYPNHLFPVIIPSGQYGEVFRATLHKGTPGEVLVAVKTTKKNSSEKEKDDFAKEMAVMSTLLHPNIVRFYGVVHRGKWVLNGLGKTNMAWGRPIWPGEDQYGLGKMENDSMGRCAGGEMMAWRGERGDGAGGEMAWRGERGMAMRKKRC